MPDDVRCYRVEGDGCRPAARSGDLVVVDPARAPRDGDLVAVDTGGVLIGRVLDAAGDPVLVWPCRPPLRLDAGALLGVVALVVNAV